LSEVEEEAFIRELKEAVRQFDAITHELSVTSLKGLMAVQNLEQLMNQIFLRLKVPYQTKQQFLEDESTMDRFATVLAFLVKENEINEIRAGIVQKVKERLDKSQKEHILREQIEVIREELGDDYLAEADEFEKKINELDADV